MWLHIRVVTWFSIVCYRGCGRHWDQRLEWQENTGKNFSVKIADLRAKIRTPDPVKEYECQTLERGDQWWALIYLAHWNYYHKHKALQWPGCIRCTLYYRNIKYRHNFDKRPSWSTALGKMNVKENKWGRHGTYNVTSWRVRVTTFATGSQYALPLSCWAPYDAVSNIVRFINKCANMAHYRNCSVFLL
jgi:hypothetical protein